MRRITRTLAFAVALALALASADASAQGWQREPLRRALELLLSYNLGADVSIEAIEGPLHPDLTLRGITVERDGRRLLQIERFLARVDAWALFREDRPLVQRLEIDGADWILSRSPDGSWRLPRRPAPAEAKDEAREPGRRWIQRIGVGEIVVRRSRITLRDAGLPETLGLGVELTARDLTLPWEGPAARRTAATAEVTLDPAAPGLAELGGGALRLVLADGRLRLESASLTGAFGALRPAGSADLGAWSDAGFQGVPPLELNVVGSLASAPAGVRRALSGDLHVRLASAGGRLLHLERLDLAGGPFPVETVSAAELRLVDGGVRVEGLRLASDEQSLAVDGALTTQGLRELDVRAERLDVAMLGVLFDSPVALAGRAEAQLRLDGPYARPTLAGNAEWRQPQIGQVALERITGEATAHEGRVALGARAYAEGREVLSARGAFRAGAEAPPLLSTPETELAVSGEDVELGLLEPFLGRLVRDLRGRAHIDVALRGGTPQPGLSGAIDVSDGAFSVPLLRQTFAPVEGRIAFEGDAIAVDALRIGPAEAEARLSGRVGLDRLRPARADLRAVLEAFPFSRSELASTDLDGEVSVEGPIDALRVSGALALRDTRIHLAEPEDPAFKEFRIVAAETTGAGTSLQEPVPEPPGALDRATVDLRLTIPHDTWVRGRGAQLEVDGELAWRKEPLAASRYDGRLEVVRGTYRFHGKRFEIRSGLLTLDGGTQVDPLLEIEAAHRVRDVTVLVLLSGRASRPTVRLESEPPMPESDVLSYLLLGRPADETGPGEAPGLDAAAAQLAAGVALDEANALLGETLPIDTLEVRTDTEGRPEGLRVGRYLGRVVFVRYGRTLGPDPTNEVTMDLRLGLGFKLQSQITEAENSGADLIWAIDY